MLDTVLADGTVVTAASGLADVEANVTFGRENILKSMYPTLVLEFPLIGTERVLWVDDEPPIADMGSQILKRLGYSVTTRTSSIEALELFQAKPDG